MLTDFTVPVPPGRTVMPDAARALAGRQVKVSANGEEIARGAVRGVRVADEARSVALAVEIGEEAADAVAIVRALPSAFAVKICQCPAGCPEECDAWPPPGPARPAAAGARP